ncbi:putative S-layer protein [Desulfitobacterium dichloroeliminans LMG P-21439]|uniref:Putative S-layer protein n=1 Tax=Desulfitobacterium dichloroeliminans (strain LMG P-21439 / DCA1) TaxID=871963 RepID=L0F804_DESDL|nr:S-layer homology domain-containing protein [Desulfitobacterium dichloroeliminans]AGA68791.1 putative S-layer protein [Desulfitobacterium dichloroeliminans LMG P-21439]
MKQKGKRIVIIALALLLLICGGIYTAYRLHPESFVGQDEIITRGEYAAILAQEIPLDTSNAEKDPPSFSDIDGHWSEKYIEALIDAGIIDPADYPDGFHPDDPITRAEILKMLVRADGKDEEAKNTQGHSGYDDQPDIRDEDKGYVIIGRENGIIGDTDDNKIRPNDPATKGEAEDMNDKVTPKPTEPTPTTPSPTPGAKDQPTPTPTNPDENQPTPTPTLPPTPTPGNPGGGSGGGSYYPPAQVRFELHETVHTDSEIHVMPVWKYMKTYTWTLTKTAVDGSQQPMELADAVSGTLGLEGGTIQFKEEGQYTLTATAKNARGKETVLSKRVTVYPVIDLSFDLPETTHTDKSVTLTFPLEKFYGHDIVWSAAKDGEAVQPTDILEGELGNEGGTFVFGNKGKYTLTASIADEIGRVFTHSENTKVYPVAGIAFSLPAASHTDTALDVVTALTEAEGLTVSWSLTKNGEAAALADELEGSLTSGGGNIRFKDRGVYMLTGTLADETGRIFEDSHTITIYPVGSIGFYAPEITHTDKTIHVETLFENLGDAAIQWSLTKDGEAIVLADAVQDELTNEGGYIRFIDKGEYVLKAAFTDPAGRSYSYTAPVKVYPVPGITYTLPETAHTDTIVNVISETTELDGLNVEWLLENGFGFQNWATYIDGTLDNSGGSIRFKHAGTYELIARITDETGRVFLFENGGRIEVLPVLSISFELPEATHTDRTIDLRTRGNNNILPVEWIITKDGTNVELYDVVDGALNAYGGKIRFMQTGDYTLTVAMTDALGRAFSYSASTTVCPIPTINLSMPEVWYDGEAGTIRVSGTDLESLTSEWTVVKDDGGAEPYSIYASGTLTKAGGSLTFPTKGQYTLLLTMTDPTGRSFTKSRSFTVFPIPTMSISVPPLTYSTDSMAITVSGTELNGTDTAWFISVDGGQAESYTQYATGTVGTGGGSLTISTDKTIAVKLIGETTDVNGRKFTFTSNTATIKPIASFPFTIPSSVHIGSNINVSLPTMSGLEGRTLTWSLTKGGSPASYTGSLSNSGGAITISVPGSYVLTASTTDNTGRAFTYSQSINITNTAPNKPTGSATVTRTALNGKLKVNISAFAADPDDDTVTLEYSGNTADSYYSVGTHTVYVRAKDAWGLYSDWTPITFTVNNSAPTTPVINRTPDGNSIAPGVPITITASSSDADGDAINYVWEGRPAQTSTAYPLGKNVVRVKAVDSTGAESPWAAIVFFIADPNRGGGMTLTGPESVILEQGIAGATITNYTFTVPPVSGHSGDDYGRVRGYNVLTGQWDQLNYGTTTNGITFSRSLSPGIYSQLEFYYYTNHDCMYNKSNITYSVSFYFQ